MSFVAEPSLVDQNVKEEPEWECFSKEAFIKTDCIPSNDEVCLTEERSMTEEMATARLYIDHEVKRDLVLGPELLQSPVFDLSINEAVTIKQEPSGATTRKSLEEQLGLRKCSVRLEHIPQHIQEQHLKYNTQDNNSNNMQERSINTVVIVTQPSGTESSKRLEAKCAHRRCSVRLERMPQHVLERYLKYNSNKNTLKKEIITFTYYSCHICTMQFAEAKDIKTPYTCKVCHMIMKNPKWRSYPRTDKSNIYELIPEGYLTKFEGRRKTLLRKKQQRNMPTCSGRWRASASSGQKATIIYNNNNINSNNNSDSNPISTKYITNETNLEKERILAMDQLKKLTGPQIYSCKMCMEIFPRRKDWVHHINTSFGNICPSDVNKLIRRL